MIAVLAGNHQQYKLWLREREPGVRESRVYRYISDPCECLGRDVDDVIVTGTFWERPDAWELHTAARRAVRKAATMKPTPTVGRIVHYVAPGGRHLAAIVTVERSLGACSLYVFDPQGCRFEHHVDEDQTLATPGTWHWPEREA